MAHLFISLSLERERRCEPPAVALLSCGFRGNRREGALLLWLRDVRKPACAKACVPAVKALAFGYRFAAMEKRTGDDE